MDPHIPPQQRREHADPTERAGAVPKLMLALVLALVVAGVAYICAEPINQPSAWGDGRDARELAGPTGPQAGAAINAAAPYASLCAACHQASGQGLPGVFPPLAGSEWVNGNPGTAAAIVLYGVSGPLTVAGRSFNGAMPPFKGQLSDEQVAALLSHVRSQWGNTSASVSSSEVAQVRERFKDRVGPFSAEKDLPAHQ